jgi:Cyclic nucleotide-binding domain
LMMERLSRWLMTSEETLERDIDFVKAALFFAVETTTLNYTSDRTDVNWYPSGFYIIEQGEVSNDLFLILSGKAKAVHEEDDGTLTHRVSFGPGAFFGEVGVATQQRRTAHVIAEEDVTCLVFSMTESIDFVGRGSDANISGGDSRIEAVVEQQEFTTKVDVSDHVKQKVAAMASHHTQYPIDPDMFPMEMLTEMFGTEYFVRILPRTVLEDNVFGKEG